MSIAQAAIEAQKNGCVVGLRTDKVLPRLEIDEFILDKDVLNLFLLALIQLQDDKIHKEAFSWYQIAGIHGRPFADWDQVHGKGRDFDRQSEPVAAGYCSHSSVTFPTWHRPYMAMMEQAVYVAMVEVAKQYTDHATQQKYLNACTRFRFPYWDPCLPRHTGYDKYIFGIPQIVSNPQVWVRWPRDPGTLVPESNPLYSYNFPKEVQSDNHHDFHWNTMTNTMIRYGGNKHTLRAPRLKAETAETTDYDVDTYMTGHIQADIGSSLYKVLTVSQDWSTFSNDRAPIERLMVADSQGKSDVHEIYHTVEGFHDNIHSHIGNGTLPGGSGHMGDPQLAAFDPIFWLHHCNIDRITAIWQARNPGAWWKEHAMARSDANWAVPAGHIQRPSDPLLPFRKSRRVGDDDEFWTSDGVKNWEDLGYTYLGKRINRNHSTGDNEQITFEIRLENTDQKNLNAYCSQFYGWMDSSEAGVARPVPDLLYQFYPIPIDQVEALTGKHIDRPPMPRPHPSRTPNDPKPNPLYPDYTHLHGLLLDGCLRQWNAYITVEKFALRNSFQIYIFIGDFCQDRPDDWAKEPNLAGVNGIFASDPKSGGCDNCERQAESSLLITDVVPLTGHLIKWIRSGKRMPEHDPKGLVLQNLSPDQVMPFLYKNMHWRVATIHGEHKQRSEVPGLKVAVADQVVRLPKTFEDNPEYEDVAFKTGATHGRQGGLDHNEAMAQVRIS